jgi:hypothetical protein
MFPGTEKNSAGPKRPLSVKIELQHLELLQKLFEDNDANALSAVVRAAWALLLHTYTGLEQVVFGFEETGNTPRITAMENSVGGETLIPAVCMQMDEDMSFGQFLEHAKNVTPICTNTNDQINQYNSSVLVRFGAHTAVSGEHQMPGKTFILSEKVK